MQSQTHIRGSMKQKRPKRLSNSLADSATGTEKELPDLISTLILIFCPKKTKMQYVVGDKNARAFVGRK